MFVISTACSAFAGASGVQILAGFPGSRPSIVTAYSKRKVREANSASFRSPAAGGAGCVEPISDCLALAVVSDRPPSLQPTSVNAAPTGTSIDIAGVKPRRLGPAALAEFRLLFDADTTRDSMSGRARDEKSRK